MKKIVLGFIAFGLLTLTGCEKDDDTDTTEKTETSDGDGRTDSDKGDDITGTSSDEGTDSDKGDDITDTSSDEGTDSDDGTTETSSDDGSSGSDDEGTDTDSGDGTTDDSSVEYGEGVIDIEGNTYKSVIIGEQEWMTENLRTTKYSDGTGITNVTDNGWYSLSSGAWCNYNNDNKYDTIYGKLYNWYAVETELLCPTGWHVPTNAEWNLLEDYLIFNEHWETGTVLKSNFGWNDREEGTNGNGTDDYGWLGLPGGCRSFFAGGFDLVGEEGFWWSSDESSSSFAWLRSLNPYPELFFSNNGRKKKGFSVRCLKD